MSATRDDRVLVTGTRLPVGLELVRKLGRTGRHVVATDSFANAPGMHSRYAAEHEVTHSPRDESERFVEDIATIARERGVARVILTFEEVFYLARRRHRIGAELFAPSAHTLERLHNKASFIALARELDLPVPKTRLAKTRGQLARAIAELGPYFARPVYTRGGVTLLTNRGPLADETDPTEVEPTRQNPFLVQPFVEGRDVCSVSICHHGRITGHVSYAHPLTLEHAGGITFESLNLPETLEIAQRIAEATNYHGFLSLDYLETERGLSLVECNPRPTSGIALMPDALFDRALTGEVRAPLVAPARTRRQMSLALLRNIVVHPGEAPSNVRALFTSGADFYFDAHDPLPVLFQVLAYARVRDYRRRHGGTAHRYDLMQGYFEDLTYDGAPSTRGAPSIAALSESRRPTVRAAPARGASRALASAPHEPPRARDPWPSG
ncbi:MAG: ATP-grasp domain-containing protein [Sandaracinaceae bacterium]